VAKSEAAQAATPSLRALDPVADLLARLRLDRAARKEGVLIVEGKSDRRVLARVLGIETRQIFQVAGRTNVLRSARTLAEHRQCGVVCVADRDFDESETNWPGFSWLVFFDHADLEAMLLNSPALERFLEVWSSESKLAAFGGTQVVLRYSTDAVMPLAALRAATARGAFHMSFDNVRVTDVATKDGTLKTASLLGRAMMASRESPEKLNEVLAESPPTCPHTGAPLVRGRDVMALVGILLRKQIGALNAHQAHGNFVERSITLAFGEGDFSGTPFAARLSSSLAAVACGSHGT
jgi:hypothetical protein